MDPTKLKQNLRVFMKLMNLRECAWGNSMPHYHQDHSAGKGDNSLQHKNLVQIDSYASSYKNYSSKSSSGQGMGNILENFGVEPDESQK